MVMLFEILHIYYESNTTQHCEVKARATSAYVSHSQEMSSTPFPWLWPAHARLPLHHTRPTQQFTHQPSCVKISTNLCSVSLFTTHRQYPMNLTIVPTNCVCGISLWNSPCRTHAPHGCRREVIIPQDNAPPYLIYKRLKVPARHLQVVLRPSLTDQHEISPSTPTLPRRCCQCPRLELERRKKGF